jgi:alpha-1,6-mannosyltransferase
LPLPTSTTRRLSALPLLFGSAVWIALCLVAMRLGWSRDDAQSFALVPQLLAAAPLALWTLLLGRGHVPALDNRATAFLLIAAAALRLVLLTADPAQSDDIYRYLWEGRVQLAGENPFLHPPDSQAFSALRDSIWERINHPEYSAIYPPLAQASFLLVAAIHPSVTALKLFFTLCDLLTLLVLLRWLDLLAVPRAWAALWAFHPLVIAEFSGNGHLDSLMILMTVTALWRLDAGRDGQAALALAGAVASKLIPLLLLPYFFWKLKRRLWILLPPLLVALAYLPYAGAGERLFASLWIYQRDWLYNAPVFDFARDALFGTDGWLARYWFYAALLLLGAALWARRTAPAAAALPVLGFYQVAGPVVHPWYLCIFVALACVRRGAWPWIWLTAAVPLVYWGEDRLAVRLLVWSPFLLGLAAQAALTLLPRRPFPPPPGD